MTRRFAVNSSPLILLGRISRLDLLPALAEQVVVPRAVVDELAAKEDKDWLAHTVATHPGLAIVESPTVPEDIRRWNLGSGESAVLAYCALHPGFRAVLDDLRGRRCAQALGLPLFGTLGVIVEARRQELIPAARPLIAAILGVGYRIDEELIRAALREVDESWDVSLDP